MRFGLFYEHQLPRPWDSGAEHQLFQDALAQIELADRVGFEYVWAVEHHFLEEYSHSSAPEVFLAACSQRTRRSMRPKPRTSNSGTLIAAATQPVSTARVPTNSSSGRPVARATASTSRVRMRTGGAIGGGPPNQASVATPG